LRTLAALPEPVVVRAKPTPGAIYFLLGSYSSRARHGDHFVLRKISFSSFTKVFNKKSQVDLQDIARWLRLKIAVIVSQLPKIYTVKTTKVKALSRIKWA